MAANTLSKIQAALDDHLATITLPAGIDGIVWHGRDNGAFSSYLYARIFPNVPVTYGLAGTGGQARGLYQVSVVKARVSGDVMPWNVHEIAGAVIEHFKGKTLFNSDAKVIINRIPYASPDQMDSEAITVPVTIPYISSEKEV